MLEVEQVRDVAVRWHVMSLAVLNAAATSRRTTWSDAQASGPVRVCIAAEQEHGPEVLGCRSTPRWAPGSTSRSAEGPAD